jgi:hypothetical protein
VKVKIRLSAAQPRESLSTVWSGSGRGYPRRRTYFPRVRSGPADHGRWKVS